jgi:hypothetical protein
VSQNGYTVRFLRSLQHIQGSDPLTQERDISPNEDVNYIISVAIFDSGDQEDFRITRFYTGLPVISELRMSKTFIMFGHQQHLVSTGSEFRSEFLQGPFSVIRPIRVDVASGDNRAGLRPLI